MQSLKKQHHFFKRHSHNLVNSVHYCAKTIHHLHASLLSPLPALRAQHSVKVGVMLGGVEEGHIGSHRRLRITYSAECEVTSSI